MSKVEIEIENCPICDSTDYEELYFDIDNKICGCSDCISVRDAYDYFYEKYERAKEAHDDMMYEIWKDKKLEGGKYGIH